jgi:hypothetical protein
MSDETGSLSDDVRAALEATCDALMMIESLRTKRGQHARDPGPHLIEAIAMLRQAIKELRLARGGEESVVGRGFVVSYAPVVGDREARSFQASPRRTA